MSGWIKWEKDLESDPRVLRMARELKRMCNALPFHPVTLVCGGLLRMWSYADSHIRDDDTLDLGRSELDEIIGIEGFCSLLPADWLVEINENTVELPNFQEHNGVEAKRRALTQKRVKRHRNASSVTEALPDQDQTRLDQDQQTGGADALPPVPTSESKKRPSRRCPSDFNVTDELLVWASTECPGLNVEHETKAFRDYEFRNAHTDWRATWRTWMRKAHENRTRRNGSHGPQQPVRRAREFGT